MTHEEIKILISAYLDGEVTPSEKTIVEEHLSSCQSCQKDYRSYQAISSSLSKWADETLSPDESIKIQKSFEKRRESMFTKRNAVILGTVLFLGIIIGVQQVQILPRSSVQGRLKSASDDIGDQYAEGNLRGGATMQRMLPQVHPMQLASAKMTPSYEPYYMASNYSVGYTRMATKQLGAGLVGADASSYRVRSGLESTTYTSRCCPGTTTYYDLNNTWNSPQPTQIYPYPVQNEGSNTEQYDHFNENTFLGVKENPLSTFSIDVDTASYSNIRRFLTQGQMPPQDAVHIEEMINYFHYDYPQPSWNNPFSITTEMTPCPWNRAHNLVLVGLQGKKIATENLPASNLVLLVDVSGSMGEADKLPLVKSSLRLLVEQLRPQDTVSIATFSSFATRLLDPTSGRDKDKIEDAIDSIEAGGSTNGEDGLELAYKIAKENFKPNGNNRIIVTTDGDFNVGTINDGNLIQMIEKKRDEGTYLTVLGFGMGNLKASRMEKLADSGNGNYAYIDSLDEARKVLVQQLGGTLYTIAKDVKIQVEFNPAQVKAYRLVGYEKRKLEKEDFNNDKKDAGELGAGHSVTALYEIVPAASTETFDSVDALKYQTAVAANPNSISDEVMTVKLRYKDPHSKDDKSKLIVKTIKKDQLSAPGSENLRFAAAVAEFGMLLRTSKYKGTASYLKIINEAQLATGEDQNGQRAEFFDLVQRAGLLDHPIKPSHNEDQETINVSTPSTTDRSLINSHVLNFDGTNQAVNTNYNGVLGANARTITAWIKTSSTSNDFGKAEILSYGGPAYFRFLTIDTYGNWGPAIGKTGLSFDQDGAAITYDAPNLYDNNWHFVAMVIPASATLNDIKFYEDGNLLSTVNVSYASQAPVNTTPGGDPVTIGGTVSGSDLFKGSIGEVRIYDNALSSLDILKLYSKTKI